MPSSTPPPVPPPRLQTLPSPVVGQSNRIDLREIKSKIVKRIGPDRSKKYFRHLQRFLSSKLSKTEFDKLCLTVLGHEILALHNHLIRSILHNVCRASGPPTINLPKVVGGATNSSLVPIPSVPVWDNGDVPYQPTKDRHLPNRRADAFTQQSSLNHCVDVIRENGVPHLSDLKRFAQLQQSELVEPLDKRSCLEKASSDVLDSPHSNSPVGVIATENWDEIAQHARGPVHAPLGIPLCSANFSGTWKPLLLACGTGSDSSIGCYELGQLCDTLSLRKRIEKIADIEGLGGVSLECANLLNNGMDVFLKRLIDSCVQLVRSRSRHGQINNLALKQQMSRKLINGVCLQNHMDCQSGSAIPETSSISLQDLKVVSEINRQLLGVNASMLLAKINSYD